MGRHNSGMYYLKAAEKNGLKVKNGKGDHFKVYAPSGEMMVVPLHDELKNGTECTIRKFFLKLGILLDLAAIVYLGCLLWGTL